MSSTPSATSPNACSMASAENWRFCLRKIGLKRLICWLKRAPSERLGFVAQRRAEVMEEPPLRFLVRLLAHESEHVAQIDVLRLNAQARFPGRPIHQQIAASRSRADVRGKAPS